MRAMAGDLAGRLGGSRGTDRVLRGAGKRYEITRDGFREIAAGGDLRRMAFVDGGNAVISESPVFVAAVNRVYYALFRGAEKLRPRAANRLQFLSYVLAGAAGSSGGGTAEYAVRLFPYGDAGGLPREDDMAASTDRIEQFMEGEGRLAGEAVRRAERGRAGGAGRARQGGHAGARRLAARPAEGGEKVRGRPVPRGGGQGGSRVRAGEDQQAGHRVRRPAAGPHTGDLRGGRAAARVVHQGGREDIAWRPRVRHGGKAAPAVAVPVQVRDTAGAVRADGEAEISSVLHSLAANSGDASMPGYPYGLIDADRFAKVRSGEIPAFRAELGARASSDCSLSRILRYEAMQSAHDWLNRVT